MGEARTVAEGLRRPVSERIGELRDKVEYRRAVTEQDHEAIFRLRYDACRRIAAIDPSDGQRFDDSFDRLPNVHQLGVYIEDRLAASLRIHVLSQETPWSPALDNFPDVLEPELASNKRIVDPNRLMSDFDASRRYPELPYVTLRLAYMAAVHFEADLVTASVRREHEAFYRREMLMRPACPPRPYGTVNKLIGLMVIDFPRDGHAIEERRPFYKSQASEREHLFAPSRASGTSTKGARTAA
jgi:hypothetical protein